MASPFQLTMEPETKPVPLTVSVKAAPPAATLAGERELIAGTGLSEVGSTECLAQPKASSANPIAPTRRSLRAARRNPSFIILCKLPINHWWT